MPSAIAVILAAIWLVGVVVIGLGGMNQIMLAFVMICAVFIGLTQRKLI